MSMTPVRVNVVANFVGRVWTVGLGFVFIPLYLKFLGIEAYGLVGFFATLQAVFAILDLGLGATANREMARLSVANERVEQRDLLRTLEVIYWTIALLVGAIVVVSAPVIATRWISVNQLSTTSAVTAVRMMGIVIATQFAFGLYQGCLLGLGRQVGINTISIIIGTLKSAGAAFVLWQVAPTVEAFFVWQGVVSALQIVITTRMTWKSIPGVGKPVFVPALLRTRWVFAASVAANAIIGVVLTQLDKVLVSRLLTLEQFGYYMVAASAASILWIAILPVNQALFPRFTQLVEARDTHVLTDLYHRSAQFINVLVVPAATTVVFFANELIAAWTQNPVAATHTSLVVQLLIVGTALNGLGSVPAQLQSAAGWPQLVMTTNLVSALVLVPAILVAVNAFGGPGAASVWLILNVGYLVFTVPIMHRRLLKGELKRWIGEDVLLPAVPAVLVGAWFRVIAPSGLQGVKAVAYAGLSGLTSVIVAVVAAPLLRPILIAALRKTPDLLPVRFRS